jgi:hypothetical protein
MTLLSLEPICNTAFKQAGSTLTLCVADLQQIVYGASFCIGRLLISGWLGVYEVCKHEKIFQFSQFR